MSGLISKASWAEAGCYFSRSVSSRVTTTTPMPRGYEDGLDAVLGRSVVKW
ncbi:hypothetical protein [Streptomyces noursei]|uniref:hypothetical protein n=1 Tax=Streptomyces noursei TaxID=1971 RepID=UPI001965495F|nr:hypothetical protein [Streptomyces noursei]QRX90004.1 hypothetical protein JNO44_03245 [Streptomyces noursei]